MFNFAYQVMIGFWIFFWLVVLVGSWADLVDRNKRQIETEQVIDIPKQMAEENLMVGLIKEFANLQNITQITACLPIPKAVGESIPWGILTMNLTNLEHKNETNYCEQRPVTQWYEQVKVTRKQWKTPGSLADCEKLLNYVFTKIGRFKTVGWCSYDEQFKINVSKSVMEWKCNKTGQSTQLVDQWDSIWSMSIFSHFQYIARISWCFTWDGKVFSVLPWVDDRSTTSGEKENKIVPWWKCEKAYDRSNADLVIQRIPPLAAALKYGCFCRGLKNTLNLTSAFTVRRGTLFSCRKSTIRSPGHLVWALSDGTWTTHLPLDGKVKQITLGMPTLCPI
ncbi:uncharacterized protein LOC129783006 [Falco peregrinus]|uniref:uncharacterized protein LOC129783006 n=1 Tax=Falco peregrinus TaxID=8954 RepID=UPI002479A9B2|nr:uncharacterized protein LOC129783006 [Falco peregrinus]